MFSEKLGNYEAKVNPDLWANVASQVGAASSGAAGAGGMSLLTKAIIGVSGAAVLTTGVILWKGGEEEPTVTEPAKKEIPTTSQEKEKQEPTEVVDNDPVVATIENEGVSTTNTVSSDSEPLSNPVTNTTEGNNEVVNTTTVPNPEDLDLKPRVNDPDQKVKEDKAIASIKEAQEKDRVELSHSNNVAKEDEPITTVTPKVVEKEEVSLEIPNTFTPGGDFRNDVYRLDNQSNTAFTTFEFVIYNQMGKIVMLAKDPNFQWTGIDPTSGSSVPKGRYAYVLVAQTEKGTAVKKSGVITVQ